MHMSAAQLAPEQRPASRYGSLLGIPSMIVARPTVDAMLRRCHQFSDSNPSTPGSTDDERMPRLVAFDRRTRLGDPETKRITHSEMISQGRKCGGGSYSKSPNLRCAKG